MKTLSFLLCLISFSSFAAQDVTCWEKDCLNKGWTMIDVSTNQYLDFQCYRDGCKTDGWIVGGTMAPSYYTQCKEGGCFAKGWYEVDRNSKVLLREIVCENNNCLTYGWTTYMTNNRHQTICKQNNCSSLGWITRTSTGSIQVNCKKGGCFTEGRTQSLTLAD